MRKWLRYLAIAIILAVIAESAFYITILGMGRRLNDPAPSDTIIVLGSGIYMDGTPKPMLKYRLDTALEAYEQGLAPTIITTGAQGDDEPMPEADAMKDYLVQNGVPAGSVFADPNSYNTQENIDNAKAIMDEHGMQSAIIVTNSYHLWRSVSIARDAGIIASGMGAKNAIRAYHAVRYTLRESLSWVKYIFTR